MERVETPSGPRIGRPSTQITVPLGPRLHSRYRTLPLPDAAPPIIPGKRRARPPYRGRGPSWDLEYDAFKRAFPKKYKGK